MQHVKKSSYLVNNTENIICEIEDDSVVTSVPSTNHRKESSVVNKIDAPISKLCGFKVNKIAPCNVVLKPNEYEGIAPDVCDQIHHCNASSTTVAEGNSLFENLTVYSSSTIKLLTFYFLIGSNEPAASDDFENDLKRNKRHELI